MKKLAVICMLAIAGLFVQASVQASDETTSENACKAFVGKWSGNWQYVGKMWLYVDQVQPDCTASYSYQSSENPPSRFKTGKIEKGRLAFACAGGTSTCAFELHGKDLWASYGGNGMTNNAVFTKE